MELVSLENNAIVVRYYDGEEVANIKTDGYSLYDSLKCNDWWFPRFGLYDYYYLSGYVNNNFNKKVRIEHNSDPRYKLTEWRASRTGKLLGKKLHAGWRSLHQSFDPESAAFQKRLWGLSGKSSKYFYEPIQNDGLKRDFHRYDAALLAALIIGLEGEEKPRDRLESGWRNIFSYNGKSYKSLNLTLDALPGWVPYFALQGLKYTALRRPLVSREEITVAGLVGEMARRDRAMGWRLRPDIPATHQMLLNASTAELKESIGIFRETNFLPKGRRMKHSHWFSYMHFILDHRYTGQNLVNHTRASAAAHRRFMLGTGRTDLVGIDPKAPFPENNVLTQLAPNGFSLLGTAEELVKESSKMKHCVGSLAYRAVNGSSLFFHIEYKNEAATMEVSSSGHIIQCYGPSNITNKASNWGHKQWEKASKNLEISSPALTLEALF